MLNYIKAKLAEKEAELNVQETAKTVDPAEVSNELLMEFAPVMQGLNDLSITGDGSDNELRPVIAIPISTDDEEIEDIKGLDPAKEIEEDPELNSIELDPSLGTLKDIPMDANIKTEYAFMKTKDEFITEAYENINPSGKMTAEEYDKVVQESAQEKFLEYRNKVLNNYAFGFSKTNILSSNVADSIIVEFAENKSAIIEPNYQVDKYGNVRKKQIESVDILQKYGHFKRMTKAITNYVQEQYGEVKDSIWNHLQPVSMNVPIDPIDKHSAIVGFKNMLNLGKIDYFRCSTPVTASNVMPIVESVNPMTIHKMNKVSSTKAFAIQEQSSTDMEFLKLIQEAIDYGDGGGDTTPAADATATGTAPEPTDGANPTGADDNGKTTIPVETNNVSDQIAEKVATDTEVPAASQNGDDIANNIDQMGAELDNLEAPPASDPALDAGATDLGATDTSVGVDDNDPALDAGATSTDVDSQLNELDAMSSGGGELGATDMASANEIGTSPEDISNMSMDEMIQAATEKVKGMPIGILQKFLAGDTSALQEAYVQEMVTSKNVNEKLDVELRKCLGTLNDDELSFKGIENKFKKDGKKLNGILSKATKNSKVYSEEERKELTELNSTLTDLMVHFKPSKPEALEEAKGRIRAFTSQAKVVDKIISKHKKGATQTESESTDEVEDSENE